MPRRVKRYRRRVVNVQQKRPIDKAIVTGSVNMTLGTQQNIRILPITGAAGAGVTFPGTFTGLRWDISYKSVTTTSMAVIKWLNVKCREGLTPTNISFPAGPPAPPIGTLYTPEQDVLAWGQLILQPSSAASAGQRSSPYKDVGQTKSMRKMQAGDAMYLCLQDSSDDGFIADYIIQYFYKT